MAILLIFEIPNIERELYLHQIWCENLILRRSRVLCSFCPRRNQKTYEQAKEMFSGFSAKTPPVWTVSRMRIPQCGPARTPPAPVCSALYSRHKDKTLVFIGILNHLWITKMPLWYAFLRLEAWFNFFSIPFLPQQPCKVFSHWLIIYPREYRLQHSPNLVDVRL